MNLKFLVIFITLKVIYCYKPERHVLLTSTSNLKNSKSKNADPVIPARYKIKSTTNDEDATISKSFPAEFFPEVEYPESVMDSSKPFYISSSPFSNDVKSSFDSLVANDNNREKIQVTDYSWTQNEKSNDKLPVTSQKEDMITHIKGNETNSSDKYTNETVCEDITMTDCKAQAAVDDIPYSDNDMGKIFNNWTLNEQSAECEDKNYVKFINELDELMKNLTKTEKSKCYEGDDDAEHTFENECSDEFKLSSFMTPNNNDSIIELNGNSFPEEEHPERIKNPLFEDSDTNDALN